MYRVTVRFDGELYDRLMKEAGPKGRGGITCVMHSALHAYLNKSLGATNKERMEMIYAITEEVMELRRKLGPIGGNLNQALRWLNESGGDLNNRTLVRLEGCYLELQGHFRELTDAYKRLLTMRNGS